MINLKYSEILRFNKELEKDNWLNVYNILLLSNIVVHQGKEIIEYFLRVDGINSNVKCGDYDNIVQESQQQKQINATIIFWELANLVDGLQYKVELLTKAKIDEIENKVKSEIDLTIQNLGDCPLVLINKFSSIFFSFLNLENNKLDDLAYRLNLYLESFTNANLKLINLENVIAYVGIKNSFNQRYYYSSKTLYTVDFFKAYAQFIKPFFMSTNGKSKKALIFDCDNTLWKGILGEEGIDGIKMSPETTDGLIFQEIQSIAVSLSNQGVIIGLCSKNNPEEVDDVLDSHPNMILKNNHITIKKVNWFDKVSNLKKVSEELNIGLDSLVFVDDSLFEVNLVKEQLSDVTVLHVPEKIYEYPKMLRSNLGLFYNFSNTTEDSKKVKMYREQKCREDVKSKFSTIDDYLASLELNVAVFKNDISLIPRMAQITQKTNQFNLTSKRYTEIEIKNIVLSSTKDIYALSVKDKFGDSGVTGLCIVSFDDGDIAEIDSFLMSCRVIGRNIEYVFMDYIIGRLSDDNFCKVKAKYTKTIKNVQVSSFYDNCKFKLTNIDGLVKKYILSVDEYKQGKINYIEVNNG